jgi:hypothetical protein
MRASIDTDVIIHLYSSQKEVLLYKMFDDVYMYEFLYERELKRKSPSVFKRFSSDLMKKECHHCRIHIIKTKDLVEMGIKGLFEKYLIDYDILFDRGELFAVSLAKAMGLLAFVSDDTKEFGPHETLLKELIEGVIPFAFYELLFLKYLSQEASVSDIHVEFDEVINKSMSERPMQFKSRMMRTVRRFSKNYGTIRDVKWLSTYCVDNQIDYRAKMIELKQYLKKIDKLN